MALRVTYKPTAGMLLAIDDPDTAPVLDVARCRLRGLLDVRHEPTAAGYRVWNAERLRLEALRAQAAAHG